VKTHTDFDCEIESGLYKMMAIGLGKQHGAEEYHRAGHHYSYAEIFPTVGKAILDTGHVLFGLAIVENGYDETAKMQALLPKDFWEGEKLLLRESKEWMAKLPFETIDLLIVDEMGKDVSGAGMDPNVIGRPSVQKVPEYPKVKRLFVRDITAACEGNAIGIGMADMTTKRLVDGINYKAMHMNAITAGVPEAARVPIAFGTDREAIEVALGTIGLTPPKQARVVRIKNTLLLTEMDVSEAMLSEVKAHARLSIVSDPKPLAFNKKGNLPPF